MVGIQGSYAAKAVAKGEGGQGRRDGGTTESGPQDFPVAQAFRQEVAASAAVRPPRDDRGEARHREGAQATEATSFPARRTLKNSPPPRPA